MKKIYLNLLFIIIFILLTGCSSKMDAEKIYGKARMCVAELRAFSSDMESYGSAVCLSQNGYFLTNAHVILNHMSKEEKILDSIEIRHSYEEEYTEVELISYSKELDLAVLKEESTECKCLDLSFDIENGQTVYALGNTSNQGLTISEGIVSKSSVFVSTSNLKMNMIATDAFFADGNSGGALLDAYGHLIGITTLRLKDDSGMIIYGMGYAIPSSVIYEYASNIFEL